MVRLGFAILLVVTLLTANILAGCTGSPKYTVKQHNERGIDLCEEGQYEQAISEFNKAIELDPEYTEAYSNRGNAYDELGQFERAIEDFDKAIRLNPQDAIAYANRARVHTLLGRDTEAGQDFNRAVELGFDPDILKEEIERLQRQR